MIEVPALNYRCNFMSSREVKYYEQMNGEI